MSVAFQITRNVEMSHDLQLIKARTLRSKDELPGLLEGGHVLLQNYGGTGRVKGGILVSIREKNVFYFPNGISSRTSCEVKVNLVSKSKI